MSDASMARELCVSKQRISQVRSELGLPKLGRKEIPIAESRSFREDVIFYLNLYDAPPVLVRLVGDTTKAQEIWDWFLREFTE